MTGAELAFANAAGEVTLVIFTTLAPSATLAYLLVLSVWARRDTSPETRQRLRKQLWVPLVLAMLGLVASATHLGNPGNALYVFSSIGKSPLSNEVLAAVVFLACAAVFWLSGFSLTRHQAFGRVLAALVALTGVAFVAAVSVAYAVPTIPTWNHPLVPASIAVSSGVAGPLLALLVLSLADVETKERFHEKLFAGIGIAASVVWVAVQAAYGVVAGGISNALFSATELAPAFWPLLVASALLLAAAYLFCIVTLRHTDAKASLRLRAAAALLALAAVFAMRFSFYLLHLTVGVAI